jgi:uncharacterized protein
MGKVGLSRRDFLRGSIAGTIMGPMAALGCRSPKGEDFPPPASRGLGSAPPPVAVVNGMPHRDLGKTGARVSLLGVGGYHIGTIPSPQEAVAVIRTALDEGVNFLDNSWDYHRGRSEELMGLALREGYREKAFLMTKVCARDAGAAMENLEDSLRRLKTDVIDLWQFHEVNDDIDPELIFAAHGAIHAAVKAKEQGKVRFLGFTGHKFPHVHLKMLHRDFPWDAVQMPINVMDAHYRSFARKVVPLLVERGTGVIAMKTTASGDILRGTTVGAADCLRYAMSLPVSVVVSGMDTLEIARENISTAKAFKPMTEEERTDLLDRVREAAADGRYERFKSTSDFDSPLHADQRKPR